MPGTVRGSLRRVTQVFPIASTRHRARPREPRSAWASIICTRLRYARRATPPRHAGGNAADAIRIAGCLAGCLARRSSVRSGPQSAGRHHEAVEPYRRAMTIAPSFSYLRSSVDLYQF